MRQKVAALDARRRLTIRSCRGNSTVSKNHASLAGDLKPISAIMHSLQKSQLRFKATQCASAFKDPFFPSTGLRESI